MRSKDMWFWGLVAVGVYLLYQHSTMAATAPPVVAGSGGGAGTMTGLNGIATTGWPPPYLLR